MIAPRVFVDEDDDGRFGAGDDLIADAGVLIDGRRPPRSDLDGATSTRLWTAPAPEPFRVGVDPRTLVDATLSPRGEARATRLRPGKIAVVDMPLIRTGDIVGETTQTTADRSKPIGGVVVELVDMAGKVRAVVKSEHDGYFAFEHAPLGDYVVRVSMEQQKRLCFRADSAKRVVLTRAHDFVDSVAIRIARATPACP